MGTTRLRVERQQIKVKASQEESSEEPDHSWSRWESLSLLSEPSGSRLTPPAHPPSTA